jgi:hypothetical protein
MSLKDYQKDPKNPKADKVVVGEGQMMTPDEAQQNYKEVKDEQKKLTEVPEDQRDVPADADINKPATLRPDLPHGGEFPTTVKSAEGREKESGASKAKRVDTADPSDQGEKAPQGWKMDSKTKLVFVMTNVDGEKMNITPKQWEKYGQTLRAAGWTTPEFADGDNGGSEAIPADIDWGKDK